MTHSEYKDWNKRASRTASIHHYCTDSSTAGALPVFMGPKGGTDREGELMVAEPRTELKRPPFYKVVLLNDDYTPMDFVVQVLEHIFHKSHEESVDLMLAIHNKGAAAAGVYTRDVAETKVDQVIQYARINDYPLQCVMEKE